MRYLRFFLNYSKHPHSSEVIRVLKINIGGISKLSKERLLDELKKIAKIEILITLSKDKVSLDLISLIFPELKNIKIFSNLSSKNKEILEKKDFIFLLSLMIIDGSDNTDYFLYKYNISKKNQKRIKIIDDFYKNKINSKTFNKDNIYKVLYYFGKQAILDILSYRLIKFNKIDKTIEELISDCDGFVTPKMPITADLLMRKYKIREGKELGKKLKTIENKWVENNFQISDQQIENIINN